MNLITAGFPLLHAIRTKMSPRLLHESFQGPFIVANAIIHGSARDVLLGS